MKTYKIPITYSAVVTVEHSVEAKSMQDAMFKLGGRLQGDAPHPFDCCADLEGLDVTISPGTPEIVNGDS